MCAGKAQLSNFIALINGTQYVLQTAITQLEYYKKRIATDPCYKIPRSVFRLRQAIQGENSLDFMCVS